MKKFLSIICLLLIACMTLSACGGTPVETETNAETEKETEAKTETEEVTTVKTYTLAEAKPYVRVFGRSKMAGDSLICDWNGCGIEMALDCEGDVELTYTYSGGEGQYISVFLDDMPYCDIPCLSGTRTVKIAEGLEKGFHIIRVITQFAQKKATFDKLRFDGSMIKLSQSDAYVEIIGDSITCGAFLSPEGSDYFTAGYAYIAMKKLDADYAVCARGGMPLSLPTTINDTYPYYNKNRDNTPYTPERTADLIIVNLGTNDNWQWYKQANNKLDHETFNFENFDAGMETFIKNLDKIHGEKQVPILFVFGCTTVDTRKVATDRMQELINDVYIPAGYDIQMAFLPNNRSGKDGHPDAAGAQKQGEALAEYLKTNYPEIFG